MSVKYRHLTSKIFLISLAAALLITMAAGVALAGKQITWKMSTFEPKRSVVTNVLEWWTNEIEKRSKGQLKIKMYLQNQLCSAKEMVDSVASGFCDVVCAVPAYTPGKTPLGTIIYVPFAPTRRCDTTSFLCSRMSSHPLWKKEQEKHNAVFGFYLTGDNYNIMSRVPIRTLDDFKGLKIRAVGDQATLFKRLGAIPVACTAPEIYTALERGLFDAVPGPGEYWFSNWGLFDALKGGYYVKGIDINISGFEVLINKKSYNALPDDIKDIIQALKWQMPVALHDHQVSPAIVKYFHAKFKKAGIKMSMFPKGERDKMVSGYAQGIWDTWQKRNEKAGGPEFFKAWMKEKKEVEKRFPLGIYTERPLPLSVKHLLPTL
jgi:TRAP-type C4-dicarboxylate transport system substrate-binding protein